MPGEGAIKVDEVNHAEHDRPPVLLQRDLAAHPPGKVEFWQQALCLRVLHLPVSIHQSIIQLYLSSTMAGCVQGDPVSLSTKPHHAEPTLPKMAMS